MQDKDYKVSSEHLKLGKFCLRQSVTQIPKFQMTMDNLQAILAMR